MTAAEKRALLDAILAKMEAQSPAVRQMVGEMLDAADRAGLNIKPRRRT